MNKPIALINTLYVARCIFVVLEYTKNIIRKVLYRIPIFLIGFLLLIFAISIFEGDLKNNGVLQVGFVFVIILVFALRNIILACVSIIDLILEKLSFKSIIMFLYSKSLETKAKYYDENGIDQEQDDSVVITSLELKFEKAKIFFNNNSSCVCTIVYIITATTFALLLAILCYESPWTVILASLIIGAAMGALFAYDMIASIQESSLELIFEYETLLE